MTPYIDKFEGQRLNSPNDLVYRSDGSLYFTDPPYGLPKDDDDPAKELKFNGVFLYADGKLQAHHQGPRRGPTAWRSRPTKRRSTFRIPTTRSASGCATTWPPTARCPTAACSSMLAGAKEQGIPDGMKVDSQGQSLGRRSRRACGFISPDGKHLGTIQPGETAANCAWGDDGKTLYITASTSVYRIRLAVPGEKPLYQVYQ